jgi:ATP phosphoribosyltransferase regulatory subunit
MRDLLPPESRARRRVSEALQAVFERSGYELITTPLFERVPVFERGSTLDPRDLLRFIDPDSGEVAALRPDITPQIARVIATRLSDHPAPFRIRYEGTVIRRRRGRARRQRQIAQVGIELIGTAGSEADLEVVRLMIDACRAAGLERFRLELSEVGVGRALLAAHGEDVLEAAAEPLARKDEGQLLEALARAQVVEAARTRIARLVHLHGDLSVLEEARELMRGTPAEAHLASLDDLTQKLVDLGLGAHLGVDLGEIRGAAYYTGTSFAIFAEGPGEAVASGGRYDQLLARYGAPLPATGAAIDLENLLWALDHAGSAWRDRPGMRFLVHGDDAQRARRALEVLHGAGFVAASLFDATDEAARAYAQAWGYDVTLAVTAQGAQATRSLDGKRKKLATELGAAEVAAVESWARDARGE